MDELIRRQWLARAGVAGATAILAPGIVGSSNAQAAAVSSTGVGVNVKDYGATGDGVTNDTAAVKAALDAANGDLVFFPPGTYSLNKVPITTPADLLLGIGATLRHRAAGPDDYMLGFASTFLRIRGGSLDGNKSEQTGRTTLVAGAVESGKHLILDRVRVRNSVKAAVYAYNFGGLIDVTSCTFEGQAQHDGIPGHYSAILAIVGGQLGAAGCVTFNYNDARGTGTATIPGAFPGGIFIGPSLSSTSGSLATLEAIGNRFSGYGQNCAGNTISAIHTYPSVTGARVIGNYFEKSACAAITAKSVSNLVCAHNVIVDGLVHSANTPAEGAITYAPSYLAGANSYPRAIIASNVITNPGGTPERPSNGICIFGSVASMAKQILVVDNVLEGCGTAITATGATDLTISSNMITGATAGPIATSGGVRLDNCTGDVDLSSNHVVNFVNHAVTLTSGMQSARVKISGNTINQNAAGYYGVLTGAVESISITSNSFSGPSYGYTVRGTGTLHVKRFHTDNSNTFTPGKSQVMVWSDIDFAYGDLSYVNSPLGVVTPGEAGIRYTQRNGARGSLLWISTGLTRDSWTAIA